MYKLTVYKDTNPKIVAEALSRIYSKLMKYNVSLIILSGAAMRGTTPNSGRLSMAAYSTSSLSLLFYPSPPESEMYRFTMAGAKQFYSPIGGAFAVNGLANLCYLSDDDLWNILLNTENIPSFFATQNASLGSVTFASSLTSNKTL